MNAPSEHMTPGIEELELRRELAQRMGGAASVERHHNAGKLTVRERIGALCDQASFQEVGGLAGTGHYDEQGRLQGLTPAPYVMGLAEIDGRPVAVGGEDYTVRGGASWSGDRKKGGQGGFVEDLALHYKIPLINLCDGVGGSVTSAERRGHTVFPGVHGFETATALLGQVPVVCAVMGTAAGGPAGRAILAHWSLMVKGNSQIFAAGPPVVKRSLGQHIHKEDLGGSKIAVDVAGTIHDAYASEAECFAQIRRFLSYMPQNVWELPPRKTTGDPADRRDEGLATIVPQDRRKAYNMRRVMNMIFDAESVFEMQPSYGKAVITALARLDGYVVGVIANNPMFYGGAIDAAGARKQTHFIEMCDTFHIPLVFLVDVPGFMVGRDAEAQGTLRDGMRSVFVSLQATVPMATVVVRKCYGMAGMAATDKVGIGLKLAWPTAEWGSLPVEGGVAAAFRREIEAADDPRQKEAEIEEKLRRFGSPFRTAEAFGVEDVIDPRETRRYLARFIGAAQGAMRISLGPKHKPGVRP
ncbi:acyl-CoA carboxylase subunit beta [Bordetella petrii]|uniref:Carboxyl transferase domain-containing protein n=1 Tax=Bordetella petrii TaxID=94624 RepID=A0ABT7VYS6_9BORD|nr:carboxyl transferase domain-containing protein [Bordetella petrii]MDM9558063.1 carboxyl transferase domain-containing protein [Bordetella petrii]